MRTSNTCAGLLALAVGHGNDDERSSNPGVRLHNDAAVNAALKYIGNAIADVSCNVSARSDHPVPVLDGGSDPFTLWSIERVGVLYNLQRIGRREWYPWAAKWLVDIQFSDGSWRYGYGRPIETCFALLVLRRSNLLPDLTYAVCNPGKRPDTAPPWRLKAALSTSSSPAPAKHGLSNAAGNRRGLANPGPTRNSGTTLRQPSEPELRRGLQEPAGAPKARDQKTP